MLEMHGTGTPLGDPIEVGAALAVLVTAKRSRPTGLSAVKSIAGHTEPAAGAASIQHMTTRLLSHRPAAYVWHLPCQCKAASSVFSAVALL